MAVVPFPMDLSPQGPNPSMSWELRSITARSGSPLNGVVRTLERPGAHWAVRMPYENLAEERRARFLAWQSSMRGHASRAYVPVYGWTRRGSFAATELLTNNTFASGTTGHQASSGASLSASDGVLRATITANGSGYVVSPSSAATVVQYAPYALRALMLAGRGTLSATGLRLGSAAFGVEYGESAAFAAGMITTAFVPSGTSAYFGAAAAITNTIAGDYFSAGYFSLARCALVDNGPNDLLQSDQLGTTWTATRVTISDVQTAPDGQVTGDRIIEDSTAANNHFVAQNTTCATAAHDRSFSVALRVGSGRSWAALQIQENTGNQVASLFVNVSTGVLGTVSVDGVGWTNGRGFVSAIGGGWYQVTLVARKASAATSLTSRIYIAEADGDVIFDGDGTSFICAWRATNAASSVPTRLSQTTTTLTTGTAQTGGALRLKGLPASTEGLLLQGDPAEIMIGTTSQLVRTRAPLNSDASGLGYWEFEPPLRVSPSDNAAVIIQNPLCKMMLDSNVAGWTDRVGGFADLEAAMVEDTYPS